jgi:hypothetical protein
MTQGLSRALDGMDGIRRGLDGMWTESKKDDANRWKTWKTRHGGSAARPYGIRLSGFPPFHEAMCKVAKLSYVVGAEIPKRYLGTG